MKPVQWDLETVRAVERALHALECLPDGAREAADVEGVLFNLNALLAEAKGPASEEVVQ